MSLLREVLTRFKDTETQRHKDAEKDFATLSLCDFKKEKI